MKLRSYNILFRLFSFLSDKTNGAPIFVKYKLMLGTLILGMVSASAQAQKDNVATDSISPSISERELITCYKPAMPHKEIKSPTDTIEVKGKVLDEEGEPIIGSSIRIKDKIGGTVSDLDGNFSLNAAIQDIIVVSILGFKPAEFTASSVKDSITVTLKTDSVNLTCYIVVEGKPLNRTIPLIKTDEKEIKGKVRDKFGDFLPGVAVKVKGTTNGVITDIDGSFSIMAKPSDRLVFSFLGMETKEISASILSGGEAIISMEDSNTVLCYEIVVVYNYTDDIYRRKPEKVKKLSYTEIQTPPISPVGDLESFQKWVQANVRYTDKMKSDGIRGEVILSFAIDKKGKLVDKKVIGKLSEEADKEALRVISSSAVWKPGVHNGQSMKTTMTISISFGDE